MKAYKEYPLGRPKPWETMGVLFGYLAVVKDVPAILRMGKLNKIIILIFPWSTNIKNPDCWIFWIFTVLIALLYFWLFFRDREDILIPIDRSNERAPSEFVAEKYARTQSSVEDAGEATITDSLKKAIEEAEKDNRWRIIRSFGIVWIRNAILGHFGVSLYDSFAWPSYWPYVKGRCLFVDRINFIDRTGFQVQYSNNHSNLFVRRHSAISDEYGLEESNLSSREKKVLFIASNFYWRWWVIKKLKSLYLMVGLG